MTILIFLKVPRSLSEAVAKISAQENIYAEPIVEEMVVIERNA
jgi:hypothetical protein